MSHLASSSAALCTSGGVVFRRNLHNSPVAFDIRTDGCVGTPLSLLQTHTLAPSLFSLAVVRMISNSDDTHHKRCSLRLLAKGAPRDKGDEFFFFPDVFAQT